MKCSTENGQFTFESARDGYLYDARRCLVKQLKAVFFEDGRGISSLAFQRFLKGGGPMVDAKNLLVEGGQIHRLRDFPSEDRDR